MLWGYSRAINLNIVIACFKAAYMNCFFLKQRYQAQAFQHKLAVRAEDGLLSVVLFVQRSARGLRERAELREALVRGSIRRRLDCNGTLCLSRTTNRFLRRAGGRAIKCLLYP